MKKQLLKSHHIIQLNLIFSRACLLNKLDSVDIKTRCRKRNFVDAKRMFVHLMYEKDSKFNLMTLKDYMGLDHTTLLFYLRTSRNLYDTDKTYQQIFELLKDFKQTLIN